MSRSAAVEALLLACLASVLAVLADSPSCQTINHGGLPCIEVPSCARGTGNITISTLSKGNQHSQGTSRVDLCHELSHLRVSSKMEGQSYFSASNYSECNDDIYNLAVSEVFIAPYLEDDAGPFCYAEIDVNPRNAIFESGIYNPTLTRSGISNYCMDCSSSSVTHATTINQQQNSWASIINIPWGAVNCPTGCPLAEYCAEDVDAPEKIYRINFYRVNELQAEVTSCNDAICEYLAWSPTYAVPPSFHEPKYFGFIVLV
jgi:hypothetical protein